MPGRFHTRNHLILLMPFFELQDPFLKCCKSGLCVTKLKWLLRILDSSVIKSSSIVRFTSDINSEYQSFFCNSFNFCVLCVRLRYRYLSALCIIRFLLTCQSVVLLYSEVFSIFNVYAFYYTGSSYAL